MAYEPNDEFFYVPSGYRPEDSEKRKPSDADTEADPRFNLETGDPVQDTRPRRVRQRTRSATEPNILLERVPIYPDEKIIYKVHNM